MNVLELFRPITTFVFDVDGVLTDGSLIILPPGEFIRKMNIKDGYALQLAIKKGYRVVVITGSYSDPVVVRMEYLGIRDIYQREADKRLRLSSYMEEHGLRKEEVLYMGDDIPDYGAMKLAGLPCCPADAVAEIRDMAAYISPKRGGEGCARDVIEMVLKLNGQWPLESSVKSI